MLCANIEKLIWVLDVDFFPCNFCQTHLLVLITSFVDSIVFMLVGISSVNTKVYFFLSSLMPFITFSCLTVLTRTFSTMNRTDDSGCFFLDLNLRRRVYSLSLLRMTLSVSFCRCHVSTWRSSLFLLLWGFKKTEE